MSHDTIRIFIDKDHFDVPARDNPVKGRFLRDLGKVPEDFDLWLKQPGDDVPIEATTPVELKPGMHFYTAKRELTPGAP